MAVKCERNAREIDSMIGPELLMLEDEPSIADTVIYSFRSDGFRIAWVRSLAEARQRIATTSPAIIILDLGLPDGSGLDLLREVRTTAPNIPVILLTARGAEVDRVLGLELGADDYVTKPFSPRELVARAKAILRRTHQSDSTTTHSPAFAIDEGRMTLLFRDTPLELTRYEYRILLTLIRRPGWVFTRDQLMNICWDDPLASVERTVDAHIKSIRQKLRFIDPTKEAILTHRGIGYSLSESL